MLAVSNDDGNFPLTVILRLIMLIGVQTCSPKPE